MLPRIGRLRKEHDHELVRRVGRRTSDQFLTVKTLQTGKTLTRVAVVVSKRVDKRATVRNRIKRQVRGMIEGVYQKLKPGIDVVIIVNPAALNISRKDTETRLIYLLNKQAIIK